MDRWDLARRIGPLLNDRVLRWVGWGSFSLYATAAVLEGRELISTDTELVLGLVAITTGIGGVFGGRRLREMVDEKDWLDGLPPPQPLD